MYYVPDLHVLVWSASCMCLRLCVCTCSSVLAFAGVLPNRRRMRFFCFVAAGAFFICFVASGTFFISLLSVCLALRCRSFSPLFGTLPWLFSVAAFVSSRIVQGNCVVAAKENTNISTTIIITTIFTNIIIIIIITVAVLCRALRTYLFAHHAAFHASPRWLLPSL